MKPRSAVILIENNRIALIERYRSGLHYFVFPGGKIKVNETPEAAARREPLEELGLEVEIGRMVAEVWYLETPQYYFLARVAGGEFGTGSGGEMHSSPDSMKGSHLPVWMPVDDIIVQPVLPSLVAGLVQASYHQGWPAEPFTITDQ
ncbi:MAG: NUDIX domain-containing protein [Anaerolineae bacterium]|nr:NUDIX domain-containing protein [Anaerolineae bacterium]